MEYLSKFDDSGRREGTVTQGLHYSTAEERQAYIDKGYIPTSKEDWLLYCKGYIRDTKTGKPVKKKISDSQKLLRLKSEYASAIQDIKDAMITALLNNDTELQNELKEEYNDLLAEYQTELKEVTGNAES